MPEVPDPDGVVGKSHGGPGHHERKGYMPVNGPMGDLPGGCHDEDSPEHTETNGYRTGDRY